jgi:hypothetical protein
MDRGAGWKRANRLATAAGRPVYKRFGRVTNPPLVANLPPQFLPDSRFWEKYVALATPACRIPTHRDAAE